MKARGYSGHDRISRYVARHDSPGAHERTLANGDAAHDHGTASD